MLNDRNCTGVTLQQTINETIETTQPCHKHFKLTTQLTTFYHQFMIFPDILRYLYSFFQPLKTPVKSRLYATSHAVPLLRGSVIRHPPTSWVPLFRGSVLADFPSYAGPLSRTRLEKHKTSNNNSRPLPIKSDDPVLAAGIRFGEVSCVHLSLPGQ